MSRRQLTLARLDATTLPDLEYDIDSKQLLVKIVDWLKHDEFRDLIRNVFKVSLKEPVARAREMATAAINKSYGDVRLAGTISQMTALGIESDPRPESPMFRLHTSMSGTLDLQLAGH